MTEGYWIHFGWVILNHNSSHVFVETYYYYMNRISTNFCLYHCQCQIMIQVDFITFLRTNYFWSLYIYIYVIYMWLLCMLFQYLSKLNLSKYIKSYWLSKVGWLLSVVTTMLLKTYYRYLIKLLVTADSVIVTNTCMF